MSIRRISTAVFLLAGLTFVQARADQHNGRKYTPPPATATIKVTVLRSTNGKPIPSAAVVFHPMEGDKDKGALELKTDEDGKTFLVDKILDCARQKGTGKWTALGLSRRRYSKAR